MRQSLRDLDEEIERFRKVAEMQQMPQAFVEKMMEVFAESRAKLLAQFETIGETPPTEGTKS